ncbi:hypothetical protein [Paenibacillus eucommiae]|uniref:Uncharacterized protein n=1 Tax=Paenibacillus eucommiae TaxID=1355755 RepID=A0ABS4J0M1_9BACL|nr:hypothetical protein [Paenibacillus eucommiae]MBP1993345.1 hypothetical protein [Paenibacillus eucommiae]
MFFIVKTLDRLHILELTMKNIVKTPFFQPEGAFSPHIAMKIIIKMLIHLKILALTIKNIVNSSPPSVAGGAAGAMLSG